MESSSAVQLT